MALSSRNYFFLLSSLYQIQWNDDADDKSAPVFVFVVVVGFLCL